MAVLDHICEHERRDARPGRCISERGPPSRTTDGADVAAALQTIHREIGPPRAVDRRSSRPSRAATSPSGKTTAAASDRLPAAQSAPTVPRRKLCNEQEPGTSSGWPPSSPRDLRRSWSSTNLRPACTPDLLPALANLVVTAAQNAQVIVVTHSPARSWPPYPSQGSNKSELVGPQGHRLIKEFGQTTVDGQRPLDNPRGTGRADDERRPRPSSASAAGRTSSTTSLTEGKHRADSLRGLGNARRLFDAFEPDEVSAPSRYHEAAERTGVPAVSYCVIEDQYSDRGRRDVCTRSWGWLPVSPNRVAGRASRARTRALR